MRVVDLPASAGASWIKEAWRLFFQQPFAWTALIAAWLLLSLFVMMLPLFGSAIFSIIQPALFAGMILAVRDQEMGKPIQLPHLLAGFQASGRSLIQFGCVVLLARSAVFILFALLGVDLNVSVNEGSPEKTIAQLQKLFDEKWLLLLAMMALLALIDGLFWFAPAVMAHQPMPAKDAIKWSFYAFVANVWPITIFGILLMLLAFVAMLPFFLGFVILIPLYVICAYTSFSAVFIDRSGTPSANRGHGAGGDAGDASQGGNER
jgi:hypothetical protein